MQLLQGKSVVITGSTKGMGRAHALAAAAEGARVLVNGRSAEDVATVVAEIEAAGGIAEGHPGDVGGMEAGKELVAHCVESFGAIDGLVTNAAISISEPQPWLHTSEDVVETLRINTMGTIFPCMAAMEKMVAQKSGSIVTVISRAVLGIGKASLYGASKGAVASWVYGIDHDLAGTGVRINGLSPTAQTGMSRIIPGRTLPAPETAAPMVVYLLSDLSSEISGRILRVMGSQIAVLAPPRFHPPLEAERWTAETIAEAVRTTRLKDELEDAGRITHYPEASKIVS